MKIGDKEPAGPNLIVKDPELDVCDLESVGEFLTCWRIARDKCGHELPAWSNLEPSLNDDFNANLMLLDVIDSGRDFRYRVFGDQMAAMFGARRLCATTRAR